MNLRTTLALASLLSLGALAHPAFVQAATYHVSPSGSDADDGSSASPWATLQYAADQVAAGDEVVVAAGSYAGFFLDTGGAADSRVVFRGNGAVVIDEESGTEGTGIHLDNVSYVTIEGFRIVGVSGRGVAHRGATADSPVAGLIIRGNTVENVGREGMYLSQVSDSLIEGNTIHGAGTSGADRTHGIYLSNAGSDGTTIRGNHIYENGTAGIHFNGDASIGGDGIISNLVIENNIIHDNGQNGLNMDGVQDTLVQNNVIYGNTLNGIRAYVIDGSEGPRNLTIVNNTFHVPTGGGWCVRVTDYQGLVVFNNILANDGSNGSIAVDDTGELTSDYNAVSDTFTPDRDSSYLDLSEWQALGFDGNSFIASITDLVEDAAGADYELSSSSGALDVGVAMLGGASAPAADLLGNTRPVGSAHDLGAYELCTGAGCMSAPDAGSTPDAGPTPDSGPSPDGSLSDSGSASDGGADGGAGSSDGGCGCDLGASSTPRGTFPVLALAAMVLVGLRRRRRR